MRRLNIEDTTTINLNESYEALPLERQLEMLTENGTTPTTTRNLEYTNRADGILPEYDIRTDRFEIARVAAEEATKAGMAKSKDRYNQKEKETETNEKVKD